MIDELFTLTLNSPITEEQWDMITDVDFDNTNEITFHTKHGKEVKFVKASAQPESSACWACNCPKMQLLEKGTTFGKWIPCSETVDIPNHEVLACDLHGEMMFGYLAYDNEQWICESEQELMYAPIAWCEKPEPYKGEGE